MVNPRPHSFFAQSKSKKAKNENRHLFEKRPKPKSPPHLKDIEQRSEENTVKLTEAKESTPELRKAEIDPSEPTFFFIDTDESEPTRDKPVEQSDTDKAQDTEQADSTVSNFEPVQIRSKAKHVAEIAALEHRIAELRAALQGSDANLQPATEDILVPALGSLTPVFKTASSAAIVENSGPRTLTVDEQVKRYEDNLKGRHHRFKHRYGGSFGLGLQLFAEFSLAGEQHTKYQTQLKTLNEKRLKEGKLTK